MPSNLDILRNAGADVDALTAGQREVFASLSDSEIQALSALQSRLSAVAGDVQGQTQVNVLC